jgi:hypothetical protein
MGLTPGQSEEESAAVIAAMEFENFSPPDCRTGKSSYSGPGLKTCFFVLKYPSETKINPSFVLTFVDGKLANILYLFSCDNYEAMIRAIVKKYGAPKSSHTAVMQNQMGASFRGRNYLWSNAISQIEADEYYARVDQSGIQVTDSKLERERKKRVLDNGPKI